MSTQHVSQHSQHSAGVFAAGHKLTSASDHKNRSDDEAMSATKERLARPDVSSAPITHVSWRRLMTDAHRAISPHPSSMVPRCVWKWTTTNYARTCAVCRGPLPKTPWYHRRRRLLYRPKLPMVTNLPMVTVIVVTTDGIIIGDVDTMMFTTMVTTMRTL
eukprot:353943-Pyramimonas_sp.AAC.1